MVAHNASTAKCPRAWNIARTAASTRRLDWTHETSQSRILRRAAVDDMQDTPPVLAPLRSVLLSVQAHHQRRRNGRFCRCQRVEFDACSEGSEPHLADPRPMELARAGRTADRPWKRQNGFVQVLTLFKLHAEVVVSTVESRLCAPCAESVSASAEELRERETRGEVDQWQCGVNVE